MSPTKSDGRVFTFSNTSALVVPTSPPYEDQGSYDLLENFCIEAPGIHEDPLPVGADADRVAEALSTLQFYMGAGIENELLASLPRESVTRLMTRVLYPAQLSQDTVDTLVEAMLREVVSDYFAASKLACIKYIIMDEMEAQRLGLSDLPPSRPPQRYSFLSRL